MFTGNVNVEWNVENRIRFSWANVTAIRNNAECLAHSGQQNRYQPDEIGKKYIFIIKLK